MLHCLYHNHTQNTDRALGPRHLLKFLRRNAVATFDPAMIELRVFP